MKNPRSLNRLLLALALALLASSPTLAEPIFPFEVQERTLANGLKVLVVAYDSPGVATYYTLVRAGSRNEVEPGHSGFAHFFEHMMFRGTAAFPSDVYNAELKRIGADSNGSTSDDLTRYYITGPSSEILRVMEMESDRFLNLLYDEDVFRTESRAVLGEYNKNASNPFRAMNERLRDLAFERHTYKHTTMGFLEDIRAMPEYYDYSLGFFQRFYRPENCIVLVVGDVDPNAFFEEAEKRYGGWEPGYAEPAIEQERGGAGPRREHIAWPNPTRPYLQVGYMAPAFSATTRESAALDVVSQLLVAETAPLYQKLVVDDQLVDSLSGGLPDHRDAYPFTITARIKSNDLVQEVEAAIDQALADLRDNLIDSERLEPIKSHLRYQFALSLDSPASVAFTVGHYLSLTGSIETINQIYERYEEVTAEDVRAVARKVFQARNQTTVWLTHVEGDASTSGGG